MSPLPSQLIWEQVICVKVFLSKLNISLVFLWSQKFVMMWTACVCDGGGCGSSSEEVQSHWLHLAAFSATPHQTNARKCEFILAQEPPAWATSVLLPATEKERRKKNLWKLWNASASCFYPSLGLAIMTAWVKIVRMNTVFICGGVYSCQCAATASTARHICNGICFLHSGPPRWASW